MSRNVQFQVLRGTYAQLQTLQSGFDPNTGISTNPLQLGELFFATDQGNFYIGTPGTGNGLIQIGDTTEVNDTLQQIAVLLECIRRAMVCLTIDSGKGARSADFDPDVVASDLLHNNSIPN